MTVVRQMVVPYIKEIPPYLAQLFGMGLQADSPTGEKYSQRTWTVSRPDFKKMRFDKRRSALESTLPPHNDGAAKLIATLDKASPQNKSEIRKDIKHSHFSWTKISGWSLSPDFNRG